MSAPSAPGELLVHYWDPAGTVRTGVVRCSETGSGATAARWRLEDADPAELNAVPWLPGLVLGHCTDWHVHLQLVDPAELAGGVLGRVLDLGGAPAALQRTAAEPPAGVEVQYAGAFLTAPGGYPSDRSWAPAGSFRELSTAQNARAAVAEMAAHGATVIKVASNSTAGPVLSDAVWAEVVAAAATAGLPVVAHAEGPGEAARVRRLGAEYLAHTPFTELLDEPELRAQADSVTWISTLDVHGWGAGGPEFEIATANLGRFHALGGRVRYGTDLGNGPLPVRLNPRELAALSGAGLSTHTILDALTPADPRLAHTRLVMVPVRPGVAGAPAHGELSAAAQHEFLAGLDLPAARPLQHSELEDTPAHPHPTEGATS